MSEPQYEKCPHCVFKYKLTPENSLVVKQAIAGHVSLKHPTKAQVAVTVPSKEAKQIDKSNIKRIAELEAELAKARAEKEGK